MSFTPDGTKLVTASVYGKTIHVWDLRRIRGRLKTMGLDWRWPEFSAYNPVRRDEAPWPLVEGLPLPLQGEQSGSRKRAQSHEDGDEWVLR